MLRISIIKLGIAVMVLGMAIIVVGSFFDKSFFRRSSSISADSVKESGNKVSFFGIFGFIPFGFSNDKKLFMVTLITGMIFFLSAMLLYVVNRT
ncbi:MAG: hypothetical protein ACLFPQ_03870 [Candidatus Woesearchaeota archaeon]